MEQWGGMHIDKQDSANQFYVSLRLREIQIIKHFGQGLKNNSMRCTVGQYFEILLGFTNMVAYIIIISLHKLYIHDCIFKCVLLFLLLYHPGTLNQIAQPVAVLDHCAR